MGGKGAFAALAPLLLVHRSEQIFSSCWGPEGDCELPGYRDSWCCPTEHCPEAGNRETCPETPIPLTKSCAGKCYHDSDYTLVTACKNSTICLKNWELCLGTHQCEDRGDLNWCRQPDRKLEECPDTHDTLFCKSSADPDPVPKVRCEGGISGQCIEKRKNRDGTTYDCFDRSDEPLKTSVESWGEKPLNLTKIETCAATICDEKERNEECRETQSCDENGEVCLNHWECKHFERCVIDHQEAGLTCGDECIAMRDWCKQSTALQCSNLNNRSTTDPELCSNFSFWAGKDCGSANFYRCTGSWSGQCGDYGRLYGAFRGQSSYYDDQAYRSASEMGLRLSIVPAFSGSFPEGEKCIDKTTNSGC